MSLLFPQLFCWSMHMSNTAHTRWGYCIQDPHFSVCMLWFRLETFTLDAKRVEAVDWAVARDSASKGAQVAVRYVVRSNGCLSSSSPPHQWKWASNPYQTLNQLGSVLCLFLASRAVPITGRGWRWHEPLLLALASSNLFCPFISGKALTWRLTCNY